jgi:hypothetical protein
VTGQVILDPEPIVDMVPQACLSRPRGGSTQRRVTDFPYRFDVSQNVKRLVAETRPGQTTVAISVTSLPRATGSVKWTVGINWLRLAQVVVTSIRVLCWKACGTCPLPQVGLVDRLLELHRRPS